MTLYYIFKFFRGFIGGTSRTYFKNGEKRCDESAFIFIKNERRYRITLEDLGDSHKD
jgi:hypothetical protein